MARLTLDDYSDHERPGGAGSAGQGEGSVAADEVTVDEPGHLVGVPDEFQRLWTPHRMVYIQHGQQPSDDDCPFCVAPTMSDEDALIVARGSHAYAILNLFPYNSGHLLICPYRHFSTYDLATPAEVAEIGSMTQTAMRVISHVSRNDGYNIGMNQGLVAGAGIAAHLHQHIVPRWAQDANFLPIIAKTKALPQLLGEVRDSLAAAWPSAGNADGAPDVSR